MAALRTTDLSFSYEISQNISQTAIDQNQSTPRQDRPQTTHDGGLSVDFPRQQHPSGMQAAYVKQLTDVNLELPRGTRALLLGANGAGKSTLMNVLGGKHMVERSMAEVLGRPAFHDTTLNAELALLTGNWTHTVGFVGHNVPYQAMEVSRLIASNSGGVDPARVERLVALLEVDRSWNLTTVSDGQRRRVQILCKLLKPTSVLLLDEITTDLDLLARQDLLTFLREESEQRGVSIVYCTHIFDGLDGWPTHVIYIDKGTSAFCAPYDELRATTLAVSTAARARGWGELFCAVQRLLLELKPEFADILQPPSAPTVPAAVSAAAEAAGPAVSVRNLTWGYRGAAGTPQLRGVTVDVPRGARCLLVGANGAGKTTLLKLIAGKHMVPRGCVDVLGRPAFHDTDLNTLVSFLSGDWTRSVACVGNGVPFQADFSVRFMANEFVEALVRDGFERALIDARLARLSQLLDLDFEWRLHKVSDGQRRRAQLLLKLLRPSQLLLLDEVTTDLDVISRQALLHFLREESEQRGTTVIYSTHIFDGLDDWPTHLLHLRAGQVKSMGAHQLRAEASGPTSGTLYTSVKEWLSSERAAAADTAEASLAAPVCPTTEEVMRMDSEPVAAAPSFASKFDRFGGASRQSMYAR